MVPTDVLLLDTMPYLASGKIDRRSLQKLHQDYRESQDISHTMEVDDGQRQLAKLISDVLKVDVLRLPSLAAAGIDSLSSIRIASHLKKNGFPRSSATDVLEGGTLADLQKRLQESNVLEQPDQRKSSLLHADDIKSVLEAHERLSANISKIQDVVACTAVQSSMLAETAKDPLAYCNWIELQIDIERTSNDVKKAIHALTAHHEMLRAGFMALHNATHPYAAVVWKEDESPAVQEVAEFSYEFEASDDAQLFRPRPIQLRQSDTGVKILLQLHHSLYDQWSMDVIKQDLDSLLQGQSLLARPSYSDIVAYYNKPIQDNDLEASHEYWQSYLRGAAVTPLPQLNGEKVSRGLQRTAWLPVKIPSASLKHKARELNCSAPAMVQAAFAYILSLYTGASDVIYGTVFSGRHIPVADVERIVGPCLNTLPARAEINAVRTCQDLVRLVHNQNRTVLKHSDTPLSDVKKIGDYGSNETLFDTLFIWQESTFDKPSLVSEIDSADHHELNLVMEVEPRVDDLAIRVTYQRNRMCLGQVDLLAEQLRSVVQQFMDSPQALVTSISNSLPDHVLSIDNPKPVGHPHPNGLVAVLEGVAERTPSSQALIYGESLTPSDTRMHSFTYAELHAQANQLARHLISQGVKPDDLVCVCMDKSLQLYVSILAVLKAGAGYLPLLPDTPQERFASILGQTDVKVFLCDGTVPSLARSAINNDLVDVDAIDLSQYPSDNLHLSYHGSHAAYSIFTSGSTGTPKGLIVTQDNLLGNLSALADIYPVEPGDRLLQACSQAFDVSVFEIFFAFYKGMPLCFSRKDELFLDIEHGIRALEVTHLSLTPTVAALVHPANVPAVRFLVTAGEAMTDVVHRRWAGKGLHQGYGPSETTNICTVNPQMPVTDIISNIGPAFPNTSAFVIRVDGPFEILPFGAVGELAFGGEQVFRGYIGREELNAEKIIAHPKYSRVYRSGDIGRMLPNGTILISGRLDDQVKIRGNRIELGEINASLLSQTWVEDCTTMVLGKDAATQSIASFWIPADVGAKGFEVLQPTQQLRDQVNALYEKLEGSLPPYMIPAAIIPVSNLPRTAQGKLDKRRLEGSVSQLEEGNNSVYFRASGHTEADDGEWTSIERELASALETVIHLPSGSIGRSTSFFALGLNSINAIALAKSIDKRLGRKTAVSTILRNASIARLARTIANEPQQSEKQSTDLSQVFSPQTIKDIESEFAKGSLHVAAVLPCTPLQEAMLSAGASASGSSYSNRTAFTIHGDLAKLKNCFQTLMDRHAILRTQFCETSDPDHPYAQVILDGVQLPWSDIAEHGDLAHINMRHPFHVSANHQSNRAEIVLSMHHAIYDGTSISVLLDEAQSLYREETLPKAPSFAPFLGEVQSQSGPSALAFWESTMRGFSAKPFLRRLDAGSQRLQNCAVFPLKTSTSDIDAFSRRHDVNASSLFQASWAKVLLAAQGTDDVCFGDVVSGRSVAVPGVDRIIAPCFNTVPVRVSLGPSLQNIGLVQRLHKQRLNADPYQLAPLRRIQALSHTPDLHLFDSLMLVQPPSQELDNTIWEITKDDGLMDLPLVLELVQDGESRKLVVHYDTLYLSTDSAAIVANAFIESLKHCVHYPSGDARDLPSVNPQLKGIIASDTRPREASIALNGNASSQTWNEAESLIRKTFSHFSKVDESKIGKHLSLYRLGLDSLNAVQVASRLRSKGLPVSAADVMEYRTPAALAAAAAKSDPDHVDGNTAAIDFAKYDSDRRSRLMDAHNIPWNVAESLRPCTAAQNGMIAQSLQSNGALYVNHITYEVPDDVNAEDLMSAWERVQRKHQALRMGFGQTEEGHCPFAMIIYRVDAVVVPLVDGVPDETEIGATIVKGLDKPTWQVTFDEAQPHRKMTLSIHHALYDAESLQLLFCDFQTALRQSPIGSPSNIDAILQPMLSGANDTKAEAEHFWRTSLEKAAPTYFPNLNPVVTSASDLFSLNKQSDLSYSRLEELCRIQGCTIQAAGQTAWALLLSAYVGEGGVTFGTVFSGRMGSTDDSVVFPAIATVPVFCNTSKAASDILADMTNFNGSAQRHRFAPLSDIQRFANLAGQNLFDSVFVYQKSAIKSSGDFSWPLLRQSAAVDYNVSMELEATPSGAVSLGLTVNRGVVPDDHARLLLQQYDHVLAQLLRGTSSSGYASQDLYSATPAKFPTLPSPVQLLHQFVEEGARTMPDRPALDFVWNLESTPKSRQTWSYRELDKRANQVAHLLQSRGAVPGGIIAVCMNKCPEATFAFIGILKAGCAFLAIDPELPAARKQFILQDSSAKVLFVDQTSDYADFDTQTAIVKLTAAQLGDFMTSPVSTGPIDPQSTSYCLYTSGTTGTPKGCELSHENAVEAMMSFQKLFEGRWNEKSRWLQFASYWFDVSVLEQFWSWSVGITLVGAPRDLVLDDISLFIQQAHITHIDLTPSLARILEPEDVPSLWDGVFITGGEALKQEIIEKWGAHRTICNGYGPTEATIGVTMNPFIGPNAKASNIGPAFLNVGSYVFAPGTTTPVLRGAVGELCVSGKLVGKGYLNRPELTAKGFPVLKETGEKIYRTGDLVRQSADGSFLFIGRQDNQAKLRGQRLEIDEIDSVIKSSSESIADVASLVIKNSEGNKETLVTFFITAVRKQTREVSLDASDEARTAAQAALESCRDRLPGYMVPTHILPVNVIPLTVNNKIDAKRLSSFYNHLSVSELHNVKGHTSSDKPLSDKEKVIGSILERMLSVDVSQVNSGSNIFSLGLSSVSAISFTTMLKRAGFSTASVALVMRNPTIRKLSEALAQTSCRSEESDSIRQAQLSISAFDQRYRATVASALDVKAEDIEVVAPCTPLQQGVILESVRNDNHPYFNEFSYKLNKCDIALLQSAFQSVVDRVQPLRTRFVQTDDGHAQIVLRRQNLPWFEQTMQDGASAHLSEQRNAWLARNKDEITSPFEISVSRSPAATYLTVHLHHALYDGLSFDMLMDRVAQAYHGQSIDCGPRFTDVLAYGPLASPAGAKSFWTAYLGNVPAGHLPALPGGQLDDDPVETLTFCQASHMDSLCKRLEVSHQSIAQACFAIALHQIAPQVGTYGLVVSGRSIAFEGADRVLGPLFNTIPSPLHLQPGDTWTSFVQRCHRFNAAALPYQHTPLRDIKKWVNRAPSDPVFDALFVFQHMQEASPSATLCFEPLEDKPKAEYPLAFEITLDAQSGLAATVVARRDIADAPKLREMLESFNTALCLIARNPTQRVERDFRVSKTTPVSQSTNSGPANGTANINGVHDFHWTAQATNLRREIARLASLEEHEVDEHSTVFSLGLDSIDAVKLASRLKRDGMPITVSQLLKAQTIPRIISSFVQSGQSSAEDTEAFHLQKIEQELSGLIKLPRQIEKSQVQRSLPATPSQEALVAEMHRSDYREYFNHDVLHLSPEVDVERLRHAWDLVVRNSPILRTTFVEVNSPNVDAVFAQVVLAPEKVQFTYVNLKDVSELDDVLEDIRNQAKTSPTPPMELTLVEIASDKYLVLSLAHAQYDGHSLGLVHQDVEYAYHHGAVDPRPHADSVIGASLAAVNEKALSFWRNTLTGAQISSFPASRSDSISGALHRTERTSSVTADKARAFCQTNGVSLQSLAQTSWALTLAHYTRQFEAVFGAVLACRDSEEAEQILFPMMNTIVMRATLHGSRREMLKYMQATNADVLMHQRTPLRFIQRIASSVVQPTSDDPIDGLFDTLFIYQHRPNSANQPSHPLYESVGGSSSIEYPVAVEMEAANENMVIRAACKDDVLDLDGTHTLLERLDHVLNAILSSPDEPTISFQGAQASICGLPLITCKADSVVAEQVHDQNESDDHDIGQSSEASVIKDALCKVSRTPPGELSANSTIESIGIDSISAIKVVAILRKQGVKLSVGEMVRARTLSGITKVLQDRSPTSNSNTTSSQDIVSRFNSEHNIEGILATYGFDTANVQAVLPALPGQMYMLNVWKVTGGQLFYPTFTYILENNCSEDELRAAWETLVRSHDILRTVFCTTDDAQVPMVQLILKDVPDSFTTGGEEQQLSASQPMVYLNAIKTDADWTLKLTLHHALYDAVSLPLLMDDLRKLVAGSSLLKPTMTQTDYISASLTPKARTARMDFWSTYLAAIKPLRLPQPRLQSLQARLDVFKPTLLPAIHSLEALARTTDLNVQSLLFAAYARVYARLAHQSEASSDNDDVVLGIYLANRSHSEHLPSLRVPTLNLVPLLIRAASSTPLLESAKRVQQDLQLIGNQENSSVGLWEIATWTGARVDTFVNFLRLPDVYEGVDGQESRAIRAVEDDRVAARSRVVDASEHASGFELPRGLETPVNGKSQDVYLVSLPSKIELKGTWANMSRYRTPLTSKQRSPHPDPSMSAFSPRPKWSVCHRQRVSLQT